MKQAGREGNCMQIKCYLNETSTEERVVEDHGIGNRGSISKLDVGVTLGLTSPLVTQDSNTVDGTARLEVCLNLLGRRAPIHITDIDRSGIHNLLF